MYLCAFVCEHVCVHCVHTHMSVLVHLCLCIWVCVRVRMHVCAQMWLGVCAVVCVHVCTCVWVYVCTCMCVCACVCVLVYCYTNTCFNRQLWTLWCFCQRQSHCIVLMSMWEDNSTQCQYTRTARGLAGPLRTHEHQGLVDKAACGAVTLKSRIPS